MEQNVYTLSYKYLKYPVFLFKTMYHPERNHTDYISLRNGPVPIICLNVNNWKTVSRGSNFSA